MSRTPRPAASEPGPTATADPGPRTETRTQAAHFDRARGAQLRVLLEDYVELIDDLAGADGQPIGPSTLARHLGVSHATVIKCIARLCREGLASSEPYRGVVLTEHGAALAERVRRRHRLVVALLQAVGVPEADAAADAEGIEHHVSDRTLAAFERFLGSAKGAALWTRQRRSLWTPGV